MVCERTAPPAEDPLVVEWELYGELEGAQLRTWRRNIRGGRHLMPLATQCVKGRAIPVSWFRKVRCLVSSRGGHDVLCVHFQQIFDATKE